MKAAGAGAGAGARGDAQVARRLAPPVSRIHLPLPFLALPRPCPGPAPARPHLRLAHAPETLKYSWNFSMRAPARRNLSSLESFMTRRILAILPSRSVFALCGRVPQPSDRCVRGERTG